MKVATVSVAGERRVRQIAKDETSIAPFDLAFSEARDGILALIRHNNGACMPPTLSPILLSQVTIEAPIPAPRRNIFRVGKNFYEHAHEFTRSGFDTSTADGAVPGNPIIFSKVPESVIACGSAVVIDPKVSKAVDHEAELAVIIELRQSSNTGLLIFDIPKIIETLSAGITLQPGGVIATGTPAGVGIGFDPLKDLKARDVVRIEIGGIAVLGNEIVERTT
jgi:2-keto-4-pentenoate hydratase/2-oxohepta-3-ene-1,7-dioic acid hydratase in catechol pathway